MAGEEGRQGGRRRVYSLICDCVLTTTVNQEIFQMKNLYEKFPCKIFFVELMDNKNILWPKFSHIK